MTNRIPESLSFPACRKRRIEARFDGGEVTSNDGPRAGLFEGSGVKQHRFTNLSYGAKFWNRECRVIARLERGSKGANPRFVVTSLEGEGRDHYDRLYCARGEMENRIKERQLQLFSDRTSCHRWWPDQDMFRFVTARLDPG